MLIVKYLKVLKMCIDNNCYWHLFWEMDFLFKSLDTDQMSNFINIQRMKSHKSTNQQQQLLKENGFHLKVVQIEL